WPTRFDVDGVDVAVLLNGNRDTAAAHLADDRRRGKIGIVVVLNRNRLNLPQDVAVVPVELQHAVRVVRRGDHVARSPRRLEFMNAAIARGDDDVAARRNRRGAPYSAAGRPAADGRKLEGRIDRAGRQHHGEYLADRQGKIGTFGGYADIGTIVRDDRRRIADFVDPAGRREHVGLPDALARGRVERPEPAVAAVRVRIRRAQDDGRVPAHPADDRA